MSNTSYETHSEAQQSGFAVERTSSGESELSSSLTEANDSELVRTRINWKVRIKNKMFWIAVIPAVLLLVQTVCSVFGIELDFGDLQDKLLAVINALFAVLVILGIVVDPTTDGLGDSERAMAYEEPWADKEKE
jgi:phi LC3 family holin